MTLDRIPPNNVDAERAVLGAALLNNKLLMSDLPPDCFYRTGHQIIHRAMIEMEGNGLPIDIVTLSEKLKVEGLAEKSGGVAYISTLTNEVPTVTNAERYAAIVKELADKRRLIYAGTKLSGDLYEGSEIDEALSEFDSTVEKGGEDECVYGMHSTMENVGAHVAAKQNGEIGEGLTTGFVKLDARMAFAPGNLIIIGGRPGMGKTSFVLDVVRANLAENKNVLFFSYEMLRGELGERMISQEGRIDAERLRKGTLSDEEWGKVRETSKRLEASGLYIVDNPRINSLKMRSIANRAHRRYGIDMIVVDYLQKVPGARQYGDSKRLEVADVVQEGKNIAKTLGIPVIMLAQVSRTVEDNKCSIKVDTYNKAGFKKEVSFNKLIGKPDSSDLLESGMIEQEANKIILLWRPEFYTEFAKNEDGSPHVLHNVCYALTTKNREGRPGRDKIRWDGEYTSFTNLEEGRY